MPTLDELKKAWEDNIIVWDYVRDKNPNSQDIKKYRTINTVLLNAIELEEFYQTRSFIMKTLKQIWFIIQVVSVAIVILAGLLGISYLFLVAMAMEGAQ